MIAGPITLAGYLIWSCLEKKMTKPLSLQEKLICALLIFCLLALIVTLKKVDPIGLAYADALFMLLFTSFFTLFTVTLSESLKNTLRNTRWYDYAILGGCFLLALAGFDSEIFGQPYKLCQVLGLGFFWILLLEFLKTKCLNKKISLTKWLIYCGLAFICSQITILICMQLGADVTLDLTLLCVLWGGLIMAIPLTKFDPPRKTKWYEYLAAGTLVGAFLVGTDLYLKPENLCQTCMIFADVTLAALATLLGWFVDLIRNKLALKANNLQPHCEA